jgi:type 1 fimbria pilin
MKRYLVAAVLIGAFAMPALAQDAVETGGGKYYVGFDTNSKTCSVVTEMAEGMKKMGEYDSKEAAEAAMAEMDECKG